MKTNYKFLYNLNYTILFFLIINCWNINSQEQVGNDIIGPHYNSQLGWSVVMNENGSILAAAAPLYDLNINDEGLVQIYKNEEGNWVQIGEDIYGLSGYEQSGNAIAISNDGTRVLIGSHRSSINYNHEGHVRVMEWNGSLWQQMGAIIFGDYSQDYSGTSVTMNGDGSRIVIGSPYNDDNGSQSGHIRVFEWTGGEWQQMGPAITGDNEGDFFGQEISLNNQGNRFVVSAISSDIPEDNAGLIKVYEWSGTEWLQFGNTIYGDYYNFVLGASLDFNNDGTRIVASGNDPNSLRHVKVFEWNGNLWSQIGNDIIADVEADLFGFGLSFDGSGNRLAIGAHYNPTNGIDSGMVRVYDFNGNDWVQFGSDIYGDTSGNLFGYAVSLNDNGLRLAVGARGFNESSGLVRVFDPTILSIEENEKIKNSINVFPNPISDFIYVNNYKNLMVNSIVLHDVNGKFVYKFNKNNNNSNFTLSVPSLNSGQYTLVVKTDKGNFTFKLIKE